MKPVTIEELLTSAPETAATKVANRQKRTPAMAEVMVRLCCAPRRRVRGRNVIALLESLQQSILDAGLHKVSPVAALAVDRNRMKAATGSGGHVAMMLWARELAKALQPRPLEGLSGPVAAIYLIRALITAQAYRMAPRSDVASSMAIFASGLQWRPLALRWAREVVRVTLDERGGTGAFSSNDELFCLYHLQGLRTAQGRGPNARGRLATAYRGVVALEAIPTEEVTTTHLLAVCVTVAEAWASTHSKPTKAEASTTPPAAKNGQTERMAKVMVGTPSVTGENRTQTQLESRIKNGARLACVPSDVDARIDELSAEYPWAPQLINWIRSSLTTRGSDGHPPILMRPLILVGPPGTGKSRFARRLAQVLELPAETVNLGGASSSNAIVGTPRGYSTTRACLPLEVIAKTRCANPAIILDEIDKAATGDYNGRATDALLGFLDRDEAAGYFDVSLEATVDLSNVNWIMTANRLPSIPGPLRSRCQIMAMPPPGPAHVQDLVRRMGDTAVVELQEEGRAVEPLSRRAIAEITLESIEQGYSARTIWNLVTDRLRAGERIAGRESPRPRSSGGEDCAPTLH